MIFRPQPGAGQNGEDHAARQLLVGCKKWGKMGMSMFLCIIDQISSLFSAICSPLLDKRRTVD